MTGLAQAIKNAGSHGADPSLDALQVLDTQANVGAVSSQKAQDAMVDAAKAPTPELHTTTIDGKMYISAKNLPAIAPLKQVEDARSQPFLDLGRTLQQRFGGGGQPASAQPAAPPSAPPSDVASSLANAASPTRTTATGLQETLKANTRRALDEQEKMRGALPDPQGPDITQKLATPGGRAALALELGIVPKKQHRGVGWNPSHRSRDDEGGNEGYDALINNPDLLRTAIMLHRQGQRANIDKESTAHLQSLLTALGTADNQDDGGPDAEEIKLVDALAHRDPLGHKSPDEHVKAMEGMLKRPLSDGEKSMVYAAHGDALHDRELESAKTERADAEQARREAKDETSRQQAEQRHADAMRKMDALISNGRNRPGGGNDAGDIAGAIVRGEQPPTLTGLYRAGTAVRAELARQGYPLARAQEDWTATQKHLATMNGPQQTRLRQAIEFTGTSLDVIDDLSSQWQAGGFPALNKARLAAAKSGVLGPNAQSIATRLDSQISDMTSELALVYTGGNASTDHALSLAARNLNSNWSQQTLADNINQVRTNLSIRKNSLATVGTVANEGNQYEPKGPAAGASKSEGDDLLKIMHANRKKGGR